MIQKLAGFDRISKVYGLFDYLYELLVFALLELRRFMFNLFSIFFSSVRNYDLLLLIISLLNPTRKNANLNARKARFV